MQLSEIFSGLALTFSVATYFIQKRKLDEQQKRINAFVIERNEKERSESVRARLEADSDGSVITVTNTGRAAASDIRLSFDADFPMRIPEDFFPYPSLLPGHSLEIGYASEFVANPVQTMTMTWKDGSGDDNRAEQRIRL